MIIKIKMKAIIMVKTNMTVIKVIASIIAAITATTIMTA